MDVVSVLFFHLINLISVSSLEQLGNTFECDIIMIILKFLLQSSNACIFTDLTCF